jgi:hypothetical protein
MYFAFPTKESSQYIVHFLIDRGKKGGGQRLHQIWSCPGVRHLASAADGKKTKHNNNFIFKTK